MADVYVLHEFAGGGKIVGTLADIAAKAPLLIETRTTTSYTYTLADSGKYIRHNNGSAITATVPPNSSVPFDIGTELTVEQSGAGLLTIAAGAGVTINTQTTLAMAGQFAIASLVKVGTNEWTIVGNLAAS